MFYIQMENILNTTTYKTFYQWEATQRFMFVEKEIKCHLRWLLDLKCNISYTLLHLLLIWAFVQMILQKSNLDNAFIK